jgi:hypothetical protein
MLSKKNAESIIEIGNALTATMKKSVLKADAVD